MKRNNMFMIAYVIFILLCAVVYQFYEFPMWSKLVAAVTFSSWLFSLGDFYSSNATAEKEMAEIYQNLFSPVLEEIECIEESINRQLVLLKKEAKEDEQTKVEGQIQYFTEQLDLLTTCRRQHEEQKPKFEKAKKTAKYFSCLAGIFIVIGFLSFLCILTFNSIAAIAIGVQDELTVWAFAIILLTQLLDSIVMEHIQRRKDDTKLVNDTWELLRKSFEREEQEIKHRAGNL